jgi:hypothetical protein
MEFISGVKISKIRDHRGRRLDRPGLRGTRAP